MTSSCTPTRPATVAERAAQIGDAEALVLIRERTPIDAALLALLPDLRLICQTGRRHAPHRPRRSARRRGIVGLHGSGSAYAPAELTLALILASTRCIVADAVALRAGTWQTTIGRELHGRTLGIIGYGNIGALVAGYGTRARDARARLGTRGIARARHRRRLRGGAGARRPLRALRRRQRPSQADARDAGPRHRPAPLADEAGRAFVNTARAGLVEQGALAAALAAGPARERSRRRLRRRAGHRRIRSSRATPCSRRRTSATSRGTRYETYFGQAFAQVAAFAAGAPIDVANPEALADGPRAARSRRRPPRPTHVLRSRVGTGPGRRQPAASQPGSPRRHGRSGRRAPPRTRTRASSRSRSHTSTMSRLP